MRREGSRAGLVSLTSRVSELLGFWTAGVRVGIGISEESCLGLLVGFFREENKGKLSSTASIGGMLGRFKIIGQDVIPLQKRDIFEVGFNQTYELGSGSFREVLQLFCVLVVKKRWQRWQREEGGGRREEGRRCGGGE